MKKTMLLTLFLVSFSFAAEAKVVVTKNGWGLFRTWYDWVEEDWLNNGDVFVNCANPGFTRCRPSSPSGIVFQGNPTPLTDTSYNSIIDYAENSVTSTNTSGTFIFDSSYFVTYNYNASTDIFVVTIYSIQEAQGLHLI